MARIILDSYEISIRVECRDDVNIFRSWAESEFQQLRLIQAMQGGYPVPPEVIPRRYVVHGKAIPRHGFFSCVIATAVDDRFVQIIEDREPGVHRFHPIDIAMADGRPLDRPHFLLNCCTRVEALDPERSNVRKDGLRPDGSWGPFWWYHPISGLFKNLCVHKGLIEGRAMWHDIRLQKLFVSDEVFEALISAGVKGFQRDIIRVDEA